MGTRGDLSRKDTPLGILCHATECHIVGCDATVQAYRVVSGEPQEAIIHGPYIDMRDSTWAYN